MERSNSQASVDADEGSSDPPGYCNVYFNRDCTEGGCVVSAIANETQILKSCIMDAKTGKLANGTDSQCSHSVKFITHFIQDLMQPMHVTGIARGGNDIDVIFDGEDTNLHAVSASRPSNMMSCLAIRCPLLP